MVIPDWDPGVLLMRKEKIQVSPVLGESRPVIIKGEDDVVWLRNTVDAVTVTIVSVTGVLVDVVAKMNNVVDRVLASWVTEGVEVSKWPVGAAVDSQTDLCGVVVWCWGGLGTTNWRGVVRVANVELVVVLSEWQESRGLNLDSVVNVGRGVGDTCARKNAHVLGGGDLVLDTDWCSGNKARVGHSRPVVVKWDISGDSGVAVDICDHRRGTSPENDRVRVWVTEE